MRRQPTENHVSERLNIQNILKKVLQAQKKKKRQPNFKMGKGYEKTFFQRRHKYDQ